MPARLKLLWQSLGRVEKAFLAVLLLYIILVIAAPASGFRLLGSIAAWTLGIASAIRLMRRYAPQVIWRLRNRLIIVLVARAMFVITGQAAVYLITSELDRRNALLAAAAEHPDNLDHVLPFL